VVRLQDIQKLTDEEKKQKREASDANFKRIRELVRAYFEALAKENKHEILTGED
jgi:hypothetical protein